MPRSGTIRTPRRRVRRGVVEGVVGPGIGEMEYGAWAASSSFRVKLSRRAKTEARVPPEGLALYLLSKRTRLRRGFGDERHFVD